MTQYIVTTLNWNDPNFWDSVVATGDTDVLDFSELPDSFDLTFEAESQDLFLSDGASVLRIGADASGDGRDAYLGANTDWASFAAVTGSQAGDTLTGSDDHDALDGDAGDDSLLGEQGDDALTGGSGADTLRGGFGADTLTGGTGDDLLAGNEDGDSLLGGDGNDSLFGEYGDDYVSGGAGDDHLEGNEGADTIYGGDGNDWMRGSYDNDALYGGAGDDYLWGGFGDDTFHIENGFGNDTVDAEGVAETNGDTLDLSAVTDDLRIDLSHISPEIGWVSDGVSTLEYDEVENIVLGGGVDTVFLGAQGGANVVYGFAAPTDQGDGTFASNDLLDVSDIFDATGQPIDTSDVSVTDTNGDGSGDALLTFPGEVSIVLAGVSADAISAPAQLAALGIPLGEDDAVDPVDPIDPADPVDPIDPVDPSDPVPSGQGADLPQIDGAFDFEATIRFDDISAGGSQRVFEFGSADGDHIVFGQLGPSTAVLFEIVQDGTTSLVVAEDALIEGETATWNVGVDEDGHMYVDKNGVEVGEADGVVPTGADYDTNLLGSSANPDLTPLIGDISDVSIAQNGTLWTYDSGTTSDDPDDTADPVAPQDPDEPEVPTDPADPSDPADPVDPAEPTDPVAEADLPQIDGAFDFEATIRFDDISAGGSQRVFEFGSADGDHIAFGQLGPSTAVLFEIVQDGNTSLIVAEDVLIEGETATWNVGVDDDGHMYVDKNGVEVGEADGVVPTNVPTDVSLLGSSANPDLTPLIGEISDVSIVQNGSVWTGEDTTTEGTTPAALSTLDGAELMEAIMSDASGASFDIEGAGDEDGVADDVPEFEPIDI